RKLARSDQVPSNHKTSQKGSLLGVIRKEACNRSDQVPSEAIKTSQKGSLLGMIRKEALLGVIREIYLLTIKLPTQKGSFASRSDPERKFARSDQVPSNHKTSQKGSLLGVIRKEVCHRSDQVPSNHKAERSLLSRKEALLGGSRYLSNHKNFSERKLARSDQRKGSLLGVIKVTSNHKNFHPERKFARSDQVTSNHKTSQKVCWSDQGTFNHKLHRKDLLGVISTFNDKTSQKDLLGFIRKSLLGVIRVPSNFANFTERKFATSDQVTSNHKNFTESLLIRLPSNRKASQERKFS
ncbi:hypothetical protein RRG08_065843, partial [Elysia crispata]